MLRLPSDQAFFGLTSEYDRVVMDQVFDLSYYTKGGFPFEQVYNMPVNVRSYYYAKLVGVKEAEAAAAEKAQQENKGKRR